MAAAIQELKVPYRDPIEDGSGMLTKAWQEFFKFLKTFIDPLGLEKTFALENNKLVATKINGLRFDKDKVRQVFVDFFIQRVTTTTENVEAGILRLVYKPKSELWNIAHLVSSGPDNCGVVFSIDTATGEIKYTSTNIAETHTIFKVSVRSRTLSGKNSQ